MSGLDGGEVSGPDGRWHSLEKVLLRPGPMSLQGVFEAGPENLKNIGEVKVLVVGAGGLGCELLKNVALSGFRKIDVIDMDTIDLSNLNRQFLFRDADVGRYKAEVAAEFIKKRIPGVSVVPHNCRIEDKDKAFYLGFRFIMCGLDSVTARRWLNSQIVDCLEYGEDGNLDMTTIIPIIDGGTEGFKGSARVIFPGLSPCVECTLSLYPPQVNFPMCTIAHTPRLPEHCVEYARTLLWERERPFPDSAVDGDDPAHIKWICDKAQERAAQYGIKGVTPRLTAGVVKRIIPAVASTNAVIAAAMGIEALKLASSLASFLENYANFQDLDGISSSVVALERREDCPVCSQRKQTLSFPANAKLRHLIDFLKSSPDWQMRNPSVTKISQPIQILFMTTGNLAAKTEANLGKSLSELGLDDGSEVSIADPTFPNTIIFRLALTADMDTTSPTPTPIPPQ